MEQEYTTSIGFRLFYGSISLIFFIVTLLVLIPTGSESFELSPSLIVIPGFAFTVVVFVFINLYKRKVIVSNLAIKYTSVWGSKELPKTNIKGFRVTEKAIVIQPHAKSLSALKIKDYISIGHNKDLLKLLNQDLINLDTVEYENNKQSLLKDNLWDLPPDDLEFKFNRYRKIALRYSLTAVVFFMLSIYILNASIILTLIMLVYPFVGIALVIVSKGIVNLSAKKNSAHFPIFIALVFAGFALIIHSTRAVEVIDINTVFQPILTALLIIISLLIILVFKYRSDRLSVQILCAVIIAIVYSIGIVLSINSDFDFSAPRHVKAHLIVREFSAKKPTYDIIITTANKNVFYFETITKADPNATYLKGSIDISVKNGLLGIPWMYYLQ